MPLRLKLKRGYMKQSFLHIGLYEERLAPDRFNFREVAFAKLWREENQRSLEMPLLEYLIPGFTARDAQVAATIIQWLGTSVGQGFLRQVCEEIGKSQQ